MKSIRHPILILVVAALFGLACGLPVGLLEESRPPTPTAAQQAPLATNTPAVVSTELVPLPAFPEIKTETIKEESKTPPSPYVIDLEYPVFSGGPDGAADGPNQVVSELVARQRAAFEEMVKTTPVMDQAGPHGLQMRYEVRQNDGKYISLFFNLSSYSSGAAHPLPYSETINYSVAQQRVLALEDLFQPGSDYLGVISQKCLAWLQSQNITGGEAGAAPTPENYRNWNITPDGLVITFDPYQVAAYAMGYVTVTIPWAELQDILSLD